jgi:hypothetical protein
MSLHCNTTKRRGILRDLKYKSINGNDLWVRILPFPSEEIGHSCNRPRENNCYLWDVDAGVTKGETESQGSLLLKN